MPTRRGFCPRCGAEITTEAPTRSASDIDPSRPQTNEPVLCESCYLEQFDLIDVPDQIDLTICATCGAVKRGEQWVDVDADDFTDIAVNAVSDALHVHIDAEDVQWEVTPEQVDPTTIRLHVTVSGATHGTGLVETTTVTVRISRGTCTRCSRIAGDYYASIVQVRANDRTPTTTETNTAVEIANEVVADMADTGDRNAFITDVSPVTGGIDIKVSTAKIGEKISRRLTNEYGGSVTASETLVTEDRDGNEVYRVTYAVRLPRFVPGDVIDPRDGEGPVLVNSVHGSMKGIRLASGTTYEAPLPDNETARVRKLGTIEDTQETTLVAIEDDHAVQVLDPETYQTKSVPRPPFLDETASSVGVLKSDAGLHILPDE